MKHQALDIYDDYPTDMKRYLRNNGWNFNAKACEFAVSLMKKLDSSTGRMKRITPWAKEQVENLLRTQGVELECNVGYNHVFVLNMGVADYYKSSIPDEHHLALYVKDTIDDPDAGDGAIMRRWYATMVANGEVIDWEDFV